MLSGHERKALHEIQEQLLLEDPGFARSLGTDARRLDHTWSGFSRRAYTISLVLSSTLGLILLVLGSPITAVVFLAAAVLIWEMRRRRDAEPANNDSGDGSAHPRT